MTGRVRTGLSGIRTWSRIHWTVAAVLVLLQASVLNGQVRGGSPIASFEQTELDLGQMIAGERKSVEIRIRNTGTAELNILSVETSCGCTTVEKPTSTLRPGGSGSVKVEFNSEGLEGQVTRQIQVTTNDPRTPRTIVKLRTTISSILDPVNQGSVIFLGTRTVGRWEERTVQIRNVSSRPLFIRGAESETEGLEVRTDARQLSPSDTFVVRARVNPKSQGPVVGSFVIKTDHPRAPSVRYRVTYNAK